MEVVLARAAGGRDQPQSDIIELPELVAMFRASAKNGRCPTKEILSGFPHLQTTWWAKRMIQVEQRLAERSSEAEGVLHSLDAIENFLRPLMLADKLLEQMPGYIDADRDLLRSFFQMIPRVTAIISETPPGSTVAAWHRPAEMVAAQAILAWRLGGRTIIGIDGRSPLSAFTQAWLERAGVHHATLSALAKVFTEGSVREWAKSLTGRPPQK
jgi:hypothetical protein